MLAELRPWVPGRASDRAPRRGDLFALQHSSGVFAFGRVVLDDVAVLGPPEGRLVTFSMHTSTTPQPPQNWSPPNLAMEPVLLGDFGWQKGYARPINNVGLLPQEDLGQVTFAKPEGGFVDHNGRRMGWAQGLLVRFAMESWRGVLPRLEQILCGSQSRDARLGPGARASGPRLG